MSPPTLIRRPHTPFTEVRLSEVLAGLSLALDLTEGQRPGHSVRTCAIGMRIAEALGLSSEDRSHLFYALLMKDLGCSSNSSRFAALFAADDRNLKSSLVQIDWAQPLESFRWVARSVAPGAFWLKRVWQALAVFSKGPEGARDVVRTRCERGGDIARMLGFGNPTVQAIRTIDEHWDGNGQAYSMKGHDIPLLGRIVGLSQTVEIFYSSVGLLTAYNIAERRRGTWFDPAIVDAFQSIRKDADFWRWLKQSDTIAEIAALEPVDDVFVADDDRLDSVAEAFARVIDAKSPWTYQHSNGVAELTIGIAERLNIPESDLRTLRRAALLHDIGKLGVSSLILDKPGKLTDDEYSVIKKHPEHTHAILARVGCFEPIADLASSHHERLDGRGYHRGRRHNELSQQARIICVADICDALRQARPYREGLSIDRIIEILRRDTRTGLDTDCVNALEDVLLDSGSPVCLAPARIVASLSEDYHQAA